MRRFNSISISILFLFMISVGFAAVGFADDKGKKRGVPSQIKKIKKKIRDLQRQIDEIELTPGPEGPQGPTGPAGPAGSQGVAGNDGADGADGETGPAGSQGVAGNDGADGAPGLQGPQGSPGPAGPAGSQGVAGNDGAVGAPGPQGPQGLMGLQGPMGAQGAEGLQGPAGPAGDGSGGTGLTYVTKKSNLIFIPPANASFADIPERALDYTKNSGASILRFTYHDYVKLEGLRSTTILTLNFILTDIASGTEITLPVEPVFVRRMIQHLSGSSFSTFAAGPKTVHFILDPQVLGANASYLAAGDYSLRIQALEENFNGNFQTSSIGSFDMPFLLQVEEIEP